MALLSFTDKGIYCEQADVYLDPWRPVARAIITHGHSDHARWGHKHYLSTPGTEHIMRHRLGVIQSQSLGFGESLTINGVHFSFHPAGHVLGSAQIRCEYKGEIWCFTGDYKLQNDGVSEPFELVKCHHFITESTFGMPIYRWQPQDLVFQEINDWWQACAKTGKTALLTGYSLGKAQRLLANIDPSIGEIFVHGAIDNMNRALAQIGLQLPKTTRITREIEAEKFQGALILAPPGALAGPLARKFRQSSTAIASGWMSLRGARRRRAVDRGFVLSDHCDWDELNRAIQATGCENVYVTHGYTHVFAKWLREQGLNAKIVATEYEGESAEIGEGNQQEEVELSEDQLS